MAKAIKTKAVTSDKPATPKERLDKIGIGAICEKISGGMSLRAWALENSFANVTVNDWIAADKDRAEQYARAREDRADGVFESLADIGDDAVKAETAVEVAGLRLKADNLKWMLARMNAKKYGDKLAVGGSDDMPPVQTVSRIELVAPK
ncbi:MAG: hypothetical protein WCD86_11080 [Ktedonobacteraceae bacterium]